MCASLCMLGVFEGGCVWVGICVWGCRWVFACVCAHVCVRGIFVCRCVSICMWVCVWVDGYRWVGVSCVCEWEYLSVGVWAGVGVYACVRVRMTARCLKEAAI